MRPTMGHQASIGQQPIGLSRKAELVPNINVCHQGGQALIVMVDIGHIPHSGIELKRKNVTQDCVHLIHLSVWLKQGIIQALKTL